jgi:hypothetical protein
VWYWRSTEHLLRLRRLGERGEAAKIAEERSDLASVAGEELFSFVARKQIRRLRREARQFGSLPLDGLKKPDVFDRDDDVVGERLN